MKDFTITRIRKQIQGIKDKEEALRIARLDMEDEAREEMGDLAQLATEKGIHDRLFPDGEPHLLAVMADWLVPSPKVEWPPFTHKEPALWLVWKDAEGVTLGRLCLASVADNRVALFPDDLTPEKVTVGNELLADAQDEFRHTFEDYEALAETLISAPHAKVPVTVFSASISEIQATK